MSRNARKAAVGVDCKNPACDFAPVGGEEMGRVRVCGAEEGTMIQVVVLRLSRDNVRIRRDAAATGGRVTRIKG